MQISIATLSWTLFPWHSRENIPLARYDNDSFYYPMITVR